MIKSPFNYVAITKMAALKISDNYELATLPKIFLTLGEISISYDP